MKAKFIIPILAAAAVVGIGLHQLPNGNVGLSDLTIENIEALTQYEGEWPGQYVPNHFLYATIQSFVVVCDENGSLKIGSHIVSGDYKKGQNYPIIVEIKNCDGVQEGAFCDQSQVGVRIVS